jgi:hypothetical protein
MNFCFILFIFLEEPDIKATNSNFHGNYPGLKKKKEIISTSKIVLKDVKD